MNSETKKYLFDILTACDEIATLFGMRHRLIHAYAQVNDDIVWDTSQHDIPGLREVTKSLLDESLADSRQSTEPIFDNSDDHCDGGEPE